MYLKITGNINLILDWDKNFSLVSIRSKDAYQSSVEHMCLISKHLINQILAKSMKDMDFFLYSYNNEKEEYTLGVIGADRFVLFLHLLKMKQIGPKLSALISSYFEGIKEFYDAVKNNDLARFTKIPGLGSKKASLIMWHFGREQGKELLKLINMQQSFESVINIDNAILNKLLTALNSLGVSKTEAKLLINNKKQQILDKLENYKSQKDTLNIGDLIKLILSKND